MAQGAGPDLRAVGVCPISDQHADFLATLGDGSGRFRFRSGTEGPATALGDYGRGKLDALEQPEWRWRRRTTRERRTVGPGPFGRGSPPSARPRRNPET